MSMQLSATKSLHLNCQFSLTEEIPLFQHRASLLHLVLKVSSQHLCSTGDIPDNYFQVVEALNGKSVAGMCITFFPIEQNYLCIFLCQY